MSTSIRFSLALALVLGAASAAAQEPEVDSLRGRFSAGMEKYRDGAYAEAIVIWEAVYRELGPEKGYRLAFNIGRAYDHFGDSTRAAEHYDAYVKEAERRIVAGEVLDPAVLKQETEAKERLAELAAEKARLRIARAGVVAIDGGAPFLAPDAYVAYVNAGRHVVLFAPGTPDEERQEVTVGLGEMRELAPRARERVAPPPSPRPAEPRWEVREERPFDRTVLVVAAGVTAASVLAPVLFRARAESIADDYAGTDPSAQRDRALGLSADYDSARTAYYVSYAIPITLGLATAGLAAWWYLGKKTTRTPLVGVRF